MALFSKSSNPVFGDNVLNKLKGSKSLVGEGNMTIAGTVQKTGLLTAMTILAGAYTWKMVYGAISVSTVIPWMLGGAIAGLVFSLIIVYRPKTAPYLSILYAAAEGLFLGAISALFEVAFAEKFPGIVVTAVCITLLTALVMLFVYQTRLIKVTNKLRSVVVVATFSVVIFYCLGMLLRLFGVNLDLIYGTSLLSIGISVVIVIIAAFNLLLDFDFIEKGAAAGAPKYMEWYGAFGLMVTLVWLYMEILRLLAKIAGRD
ncbi:MAG: Bax inhibitor-1/YccA family protein [Prevotellaceae bacterium]|jgi:uncharacterized YccA/Bax inhibitor family protein|nr:Bax inhibitor-1/YccA family protein [Prevotellaceae bacterium]